MSNEKKSAMSANGFPISSYFFLLECMYCTLIKATFYSSIESTSGRVILKVLLESKATLGHIDEAAQNGQWEDDVNISNIDSSLLQQLDIEMLLKKEVKLDILKLYADELSEERINLIKETPLGLIVNFLSQEYYQFSIVTIKKIL